MYNLIIPPQNYIVNTIYNFSTLYIEYRTTVIFVALLVVIVLYSAAKK